MDTLIEILKAQTQTLKSQYINKIKDWAEKEFDDISKADYVRFDEVRNKYFKQKFGKTKNEDNKINTNLNILNLGKDIFVNKQIKSAELHYESSILKLASRIMKKQLDTENLNVVTSHIGININTTITDGVKTVNAYTIVAEGEIQKPHYRYLVK